jgi:hypothetical protein
MVGLAILSLSVVKPLLLVLLVVVPVCVSRFGLRRTCAATALFDFLCLSQLALTGQIAADARWTLALLGLGWVLTGVLLSGRRLPDELLPVRGRWARQLLAALAVGAMVSPLIAAAVGPLKTAPWAAGGSLALLLLSYLVPLWHVLAHGWRPEPDPGSWQVRRL